MGFAGFGPATREFLADLSSHNDRAWFEDNRERYDTDLREPAEAFILELGPMLEREYPSVLYDTRRNGSGSLMRIHRDVRFSPDKRPYKENLGIIFPLAPGKKVEQDMFYFHIEAGSAFFYGGRHVFPPDALERYRQAVDDARRGPKLQTALKRLEGFGLRRMEDPAYRRVPRGYPPDHPRAALLRQAAIGVGVDLSPDELASPGLPARCLAAAASMRPLMDWLAALGA